MANLMNMIMLSCEQATGLIAAKSFRKVSFREKLQLKMHLGVCHYCLKFNKQNTYIDHSMSKWFDPNHIHPSEHLSEAKKSELETTVYNHFNK